MESRERGLPDQVHPGLEAISEQNFRKRIRNGYDQFSLHSTLRRSPRLLQSAANSTIVMEDVKLGQIMESPSVLLTKRTAIKGRRSAKSAPETCTIHVLACKLYGITVEYVH